MASSGDNPQGRKPAGRLRRVINRDTRENFWAFLDLLDERPALKRSLFVGVPLLVVVLAAAIWGYQAWAKTNSIRIARQWLAVGRLDRASVAVNAAIKSQPTLPDTWRVASEFAWRQGSKEASVDFAKKAAEVGRFDSEDSLAWTEVSLLAGDVDQATEALGYLDASFVASSPRALRAKGEIARQKGELAGARDDFEAAARLDDKKFGTQTAIDEVPLGIVCLRIGSAPDREKGLLLLEKWSSSMNWGVESLRALLSDAVASGDSAGVTRWAEALRSHPRCTLADVPVCLQALAKANPPRYQVMLAALEEKERASPNDAAQMMGWLTQIGQGAEVVRWGKTLDPEGVRRPPVAVGIAEALRATGRWKELKDWTDQADWGSDLLFLQWAYGMVAARGLSDQARADSLWTSIRTDAHTAAAHALLLGDSFVAWGYPREGAELLWQASERADLAYQAYGSLARLYELHHDADGQYKVFSRLNSMRPGDRSIANNFAYFAALTDEGSLSQVQRVAAKNVEEEPSNTTYRATYAFVLAKSGQAAQALTVLGSASQNWMKSPAIAFAYGSALAGVGRKSEAQQVFASLNPKDIDPREADWIQNSLK